jgi:hypothetical protein
MTAKQQAFDPDVATFTITVSLDPVTAIIVEEFASLKGVTAEEILAAAARVGLNHPGEIIATLMGPNSDSRAPLVVQNS